MNPILRKRHLALLPLLLIPLILVGVGLQVRTSAPPAGVEVEPPQRADYYLRGAQVSAMDEQGRLIYRVDATDVLHYPDATVHMQNVKIAYLNGPWTLTAQSGVLTEDSQSIDLLGDVEMVGRLQSGQNVTVNTPALTVAFSPRSIRTAETVLMNAEEIQASSVGMVTDLEGRELQLLSEVRVRYEP